MSLSCLAAVLIVGALVVALQVRDNTKLSPIDEVQHIDYLDKSGHLQIPRLGEVDGTTARHEFACRGEDGPGTPPPCATAATAPSFTFPENAIDTAAADPPLYYAVTGAVARAVRAAFHLNSVVTAARLLGFGWLAAGVILLWLAMGELAIGLSARTAVSTLVVTTPAVILSSATVTSDAPLLFGGAAALYALLRWERRSVAAWVVLVIAALCALVKTTCLLAVAAMALYLLIRWIRVRRANALSTRSPGELLKMALLVPAAGLTVAIVWQVIVLARTIPGVPTSVSIIYLHADHLSLPQVLAQATATLTPIGRPFLSPPLNDISTVTIVACLNAVMIAAAFGLAAFSPRGGRLEAVAGSVSILMVASGPLLAVFIYLDQHAAFGIPARYGLSLVPFAIVGLAAGLTKGPVRFAIGVLAIAAAVFTIVHLATYHAI